MHLTFSYIDYKLALFDLNKELDDFTCSLFSILPNIYPYYYVSYGRFDCQTITKLS